MRFAINLASHRDDVTGQRCSSTIEPIDVLVTATSIPATHRGAVYIDQAAAAHFSVRTGVAAGRQNPRRAMTDW